ncbi:MAG: PaaI family thioesterase [Deltaproteobacteria bacterium]
MVPRNEEYIQLPNRGNHNCFGCSPVNAYGLQMTFYANEAAVFSKVTVPEHLCGWNNLVHGGVLGTILDEIMSWSAIYLLKRVPMTKSMTVDFLKPTYVGNPLKAEGRVLDKKGKHEALLEGRIYNKDDICCASSTGTFAVFSPAVARRLSITDEESLQWFEQIFNLK